MNTNHLLSDRVVSCLKVAEHLCYYLFCITAITHGIQQISCPLSNTHIPLSLQRQKDKRLQNDRRKGRKWEKKTTRLLLQLSGVTD